MDQHSMDGGGQGKLTGLPGAGKGADELRLGPHMVCCFAMGLPAPAVRPQEQRRNET